METAPYGGLDRVAEAYRRAVVQLPENFQRVNAQLLRPDNELTLVVVMSVWAGLGGRGLGYLENVITEAKSSVDLGTGGSGLQSGILAAARAASESEIDAAADRLRGALVQVGPLRVAALLSAGQFAQLRDVVIGMRAQLLDGHLWPGAKAIPAVDVPIPGIAPGRRSVAWWVVGAAAGVGALLIAAAHAPKRGSKANG